MLSKCCKLVVKLENGALLGVQVNKKTGKYETTRTSLHISSQVALHITFCV